MNRQKLAIETTLNNRPLTYMQDDSESVSHVLTPASLIYRRRLAMKLLVFVKH